jgi:hypothetical protein
MSKFTVGQQVVVINSESTFYTPQNGIAVVTECFPDVSVCAIKMIKNDYEVKLNESSLVDASPFRSLSLFGLSRVVKTRPAYLEEPAILANALNFMFSEYGLEYIGSQMNNLVFKAVDFVKVKKFDDR